MIYLEKLSLELQSVILEFVNFYDFLKLIRINKNFIYCLTEDKLNEKYYNIIMYCTHMPYDFSYDSTQDNYHLIDNNQLDYRYIRRKAGLLLGSTDDKNKLLDVMETIYIQKLINVPKIIADVHFNDFYLIIIYNNGTNEDYNNTNNKKSLFNRYMNLKNKLTYF